MNLVHQWQTSKTLAAKTISSLIQSISALRNPVVILSSIQTLSWDHIMSLETTNYHQVEEIPDVQQRQDTMAAEEMVLDRRVLRIRTLDLFGITLSTAQTGKQNTGCFRERNCVLQRNVSARESVT